jgi:predicted Zn-dependent protease
MEDRTPIVRRPVSPPRPRPLTRPLAVAAAATALACASSTAQQVETQAAKALVSPQESEALGQQVEQELQKQGVRYLQDPQVTGWVNQLAQPIATQAKRDRPDIQAWDFKVIDDPKTVNAFATGGGHMYVYTGLLLQAQDGAEVAGVLAHEMGHVVLYHIERSLVDQVGLEALAAAALGKNPGMVTQIAASVAGQGALLAHSRADEQQADEWGVIHASQAGYDPQGLVRFFQRLMQQEGSQPGILKYLSDHPTTPSRIQDVERLIQQKHLTGTLNPPIGPVHARLAQLGKDKPAAQPSAGGGNAPGGPGS